MKSGESIKMLKFECKKVGIDQNDWNLKYKMSNRSKCWNLSEKGDNRSKFDILLQKWKSIKLLEFDWKIGIDQNIEIWGQS